jgi:hypothetical protein
VREIAHTAVFATPADSLYTIIARTRMYTYAAKVWAMFVVQGPLSVAPCQNPKLRFFATFCIAVPPAWCFAALADGLRLLPPPATPPCCDEEVANREIS